MDLRSFWSFFYLCPPFLHFLCIPTRVRFLALVPTHPRFVQQIVIGLGRLETYAVNTLKVRRQFRNTEDLMRANVRQDLGFLVPIQKGSRLAALMRGHKPVHPVLLINQTPLADEFYRNRQNFSNQIPAFACQILFYRYPALHFKRLWRTFY